MDKIQLVAVGVAEVKRHRVASTRYRYPNVVVSKKCGGKAFGVAEIARLDLVQIEAVRPQFAFEANPSSGRMRVVDMRGFAVKTLAAVFFLKGTLGQADMRLARRFAFFERIHFALHLQYTSL